MSARIAGLLVAVVALAGIVASAGAVLTKDYPARLAVNVEGVPAYVYYNRTYDVTVEYANHGGIVAGPVELAIELPETFALADRIGDPTRHGERLVWTLDGLDTGERGSVSFALQGTLPADLTEAVYDLPGYEGHTAFVEGFALAATLTAGTETASTLAVADTGLVGIGGSLTIQKDCEPGDTSTGFIIVLSGAGSGQIPMDCGDFDEDRLVPANVELTISELAREGYNPPIFSGDCAPDGQITLAAGETGTCIVENTRVVADDDDDGGGDGGGGGDSGGDDPDCPACGCCGLDLDIDIDNDNNNDIDIDNDNTNNNANDNANTNDNENDNENENDNVNENTQDQTNNQHQNNANEQTNNIDSSPEVNISGSLQKPAPAPSATTGGAAITPPSTGDAGLAGKDGTRAVPVVLALLGIVAVGAGLGRSGRRTM